jgi:hypothetical protein
MTCPPGIVKRAPSRALQVQGPVSTGPNSLSRTSRVPITELRRRLTPHKPARSSSGHHRPRVESRSIGPIISGVQTRSSRSARGVTKGRSGLPSGCGNRSFASVTGYRVGACSSSRRFLQWCVRLAISHGTLYEVPESNSAAWARGAGFDATEGVDEMSSPRNPAATAGSWSARNRRKAISAWLGFIDPNPLENPLPASPTTTDRAGPRQEPLEVGGGDHQ